MFSQTPDCLESVVQLHKGVNQYYMQLKCGKPSQPEQTPRQLNPVQSNSHITSLVCLAQTIMWSLLVHMESVRLCYQTFILTLGEHVT